VKMLRKVEFKRNRPNFARDNTITLLLLLYLLSDKT
jgi:hypothetical protein